VCFLDANGDGKQDLFLPGLGVLNTNRKYLPELSSENLGNALFIVREIDAEGIPIFVNVSAEAGIRGLGRLGVGCAVGDYDNDGREDVVVSQATRGVFASHYGELTRYGSHARVFPPPDIFFTDKTDGKYRPLEEGGVTLFRNEGNDKNGVPRFRDVTQFAGLRRGGNGTAVAFADVDNDGLLDLFVGNYADFDFVGFTAPRFPGHANALYRNNGDGTFVDITAQAGVAGFSEYVYSRDGSKRHYAWQNDLLDARGNIVGDPAGNTLAATFFDYNDDGRVDLLVGDDVPGRIRLYENSGGGQFRDVSEQVGLGVAGAWMGFGIGDVDRDGHFDIFATNLGGPMGSRYRRPYPAEISLYEILNQPNRATFYSGLWLFRRGLFESVSARALVDWGVFPPDIRWYPPAGEEGVGQAPEPRGFERGDFGFGALVFDYDNDGDEDLFWIGSLLRSGANLLFNKMWRGNPGRLLINNGTGLSFTDRAIEAGLSVLADENDPESYENGRGVARGDLNDDGYPDVVMTNAGGWDSPRGEPLSLGFEYRYLGLAQSYIPGPTFLRISPGGPNAWAKIKLIGTNSNRSAIGARVTVEYRDGGVFRRAIQEVRAGESYASQNSLELLFGLGAATVIDRITIRWPFGPHGHTQTLLNLPVRERTVVVEEKQQ
jgi:hypothetical protein